MKDQIHSIVICSGGMDSTVALAMEVGSFAAKHVGAIFFKYGQRTERKELEAFDSVCNFYGITYRWLFDLRSTFKVIGGSALLTDEQLEEGLLDKYHIPSTYVPFRNAQLLSIAVALADSLECKRVIYGAHLEDRTGYPDCSPMFISGMANAATYGTKNAVRIIAPFAGMTKSEIVTKGLEYGVPFSLTWSCYRNNDIACGECDSCLLRLRAFQDQEVFGRYDPIKCRKYPEWYAPDDVEKHPKKLAVDTSMMIPRNQFTKVTIEHDNAGGERITEEREFLKARIKIERCQ